MFSRGRPWSGPELGEVGWRRLVRHGALGEVGRRSSKQGEKGGRGRRGGARPRAHTNSGADVWSFPGELAGEGLASRRRWGSGLRIGYVGRGLDGVLARGVIDLSNEAKEGIIRIIAED